MNTEKLSIKALQSIGFKTFAVFSYILLFFAQRLPQISIDAVELRDVTESFSISSVAFGKLNKFFDYFAAPLDGGTLALIILAIAALTLGIAALCLSLFPYRRLQVINFCLSAVGSAVSIAFAVLLIVNSSSLNYDSEVGGIMDFSPSYALIWIAPALFVLGTLFIYTYAKMPEYTLADGRFFRAAGCALNPANFPKTFSASDDTEALFRATVPLKKKKYATMSEPSALKKERKKSAKRRRKMDYTQILDDYEATEKKLSPLELALAKREHAERIANAKADEENRILFKKQREVKAAPSKSKNKKPKKTRGSAPRNKALEIAKLKARHAEEVATRNNEMF